MGMSLGRNGLRGNEVRKMYSLHKNGIKKEARMEGLLLRGMNS